MAARLNPQQDARTRSAIKTSQLVNRLNAFVFGENDGKTGKPIEIDALRMKAIEILLRKSLPDLSSVSMELMGKDEGPIQIQDLTAAAILEARLDAIASRAPSPTATE